MLQQPHKTLKILEKISNEYQKVNSFIDQYNGERINYPSGVADLKTFEKNNPTIALNTLYSKANKKHPAYISKYNSV